MGDFSLAMGDFSLIIFGGVFLLLFILLSLLGEQDLLDVFGGEIALFAFGVTSLRPIVALAAKCTGEELRRFGLDKLPALIAGEILLLERLWLSGETKTSLSSLRLISVSGFSGFISISPILLFGDPDSSAILPPQ